MKIQDFKVLMAKLDASLKLSKENLVHVSEKLPLLQHEYLDIWGKEARSLEKMRADRKRKYGLLYEEIKHNRDVAWDTKAEIETQIHADDEYYKKSIEFHQQEIMVEQLSKCLDNIRNTSFQIKNIIEYNKLFGHQ